MATEFQLLKERLANMMIDADTHHVHDQRKIDLVYNIFRTIETNPTILAFPRFRECVSQKIVEISVYDQTHANHYEPSIANSMMRLLLCMANITNIIMVCERVERRVREERLAQERPHEG